MKASDRHRAAVEGVAWREISESLIVVSCTQQELAEFGREIVCNGTDSLKARVVVTRSLTQGHYIMSNGPEMDTRD